MTKLDRLTERTYHFSDDRNVCYGYTEHRATASQLNSTIDEINILQFKLKDLEDRLRWKNWRWK